MPGTMLEISDPIISKTVCLPLKGYQFKEKDKHKEVKPCRVRNTVRA